MKRPLVIAWFVGQLLYLVALYLLLAAGMAAERTYHYSVLRELETKGLLLTNSANLIQPGQPGHGFAAMKPMRAFHSVILLVSAGWVLGSVMLLIPCLRTMENVTEKD